MRVAVLGSGGIGGYYGALLTRGGHDVTFIARGEHLEAMRRRGLTVRTADGESTIPVIAVADTGSIGPVDVVCRLLLDKKKEAHIHTGGNRHDIVVDSDLAWKIDLTVGVAVPPLYHSPH